MKSYRQTIELISAVFLLRSDGHFVGYWGRGRATSPQEPGTDASRKSARDHILKLSPKGKCHSPGSVQHSSKLENEQCLILCNSFRLYGNLKKSLTVVCRLLRKIIPRNLKVKAKAASILSGPE